MNKIADKLQQFWCTMFRHTRKKNHTVFFAKGFARYYTPKWWSNMKLNHKLARFYKLTKEEQAYVLERVNYYCKFVDSIKLPDDAPQLSEFGYGNRTSYTHDYVNSSYFFDAIEYTRYFPQQLRWAYNPGDVNYLFPLPEITKSRPLCLQPDTEELHAMQNQNNILLNLDKVRHFNWIYDPFQWEEKRPMVIFRGDVTNKPRRQRFIEMWQNHPICNVQSAVNMTLYKHLHYRYIMSLEGNDVASNLKWVMSSNSVAVMPRPTCETWFMEGRLIPNYHYIEIREDYTDLMERIQYYEAHPEEAKAIVRHAHEWVKQFQKPWREDLISLMVLDKYFRLTGQRPSKSYLINDSVKLVFAQQVNAQSKAREDVTRTLRTLGVPNIKIRQYRYTLAEGKRPHHYPLFTFYSALFQARKILPHVKVGDRIFVQDFSLSYMRKVARWCHRRGAKVVYIIHDVQSIRYNIDTNEVYHLNEADLLLVHTQAMVEKLREIGIQTPMLVLQLFDYYSDDEMQKFQQVADHKNTIVFAGNLEKSNFLDPLFNSKNHTGLIFRLYGHLGSRKLPAHQTVEYAGIFQPNHTKDICGGWGLVWDGDTTDGCTGVYGEYLRYNSSHKISLYLACGIPIIVWDQSSLAKWVTEQNVGIAVSNLDDISAIIHHLPEEKYHAMIRNARCMGEKLRDGYFLKQVISAIQI